MANDWFMFRRPAGSITGTSCIFFVQVVFVGIGSKPTWPRLCQPGRNDSRAAAPRHRPGLRLPRAALSLSLEGIMTLPASAIPVELPPAFLGVSRSATGKLWRDRLDAQGGGAGAGDHAALPVAGDAGARAGGPRCRDRRGRGFSRSDHPQTDARSLHRDGDGDGGEAHCRCGGARREGRDLRRLRRRWRDLGGAAGLAFAPLRARSLDPHPRPHLRGLRPQRRGGARACRQGRDAARHRRLRHHQPRAAGGGAKARHVGRRHRPSPDRRRIARGRCAGEPEPA